MYRGTTPTHVFTLPFTTDVIAKVRVAYKQNDKVILVKELDSCSLGEKDITLRLTQEETLKFDCRANVRIQIKILAKDDNILLSEIFSKPVGECLDDEVLA